jgi:hypothetical protein
MGLAISYSLTLITPTIATVHEKVRALQAAAQDLKFVRVGEIVSLTGDQCTIDEETASTDPHLELKIHGAEMTGLGPQGRFTFRHPRDIIGFTATPGEGCAMADFGFRMYADQENPEEWTWTSYCKTQYASNPEYGGLENFITSHLKMVHLLDAAQALGISCHVNDCGQYWETRDRQLLTKIVSDGNIFTAVLMGALKDVAADRGGTLEAPILDYPNFEYLESEGINASDLSDAGS